MYSPDIQPGRTALVVDDNRSIRTMVELVLRRAGWSVLLAASAEEALQQVLQAQQAGLQPDLLVTDNCMPNPDDGIRLVEQLRQLPAVIMSADYEDVRDKVQRLHARGLVVEFLPKPFRSVMDIISLSERLVSQTAIPPQQA